MLLLLILLLSLPKLAMAEEVIASVYPVIEPNMATEIQQRLQSKATQIAEWQQRLAEKVQLRVAQPHEGPVLSKSKKPTSYYFNPSIKASTSFLAPDGQTLIKAGDTFNPLQFVPLRQNLIFFSANDAQQIQHISSLTGLDTLRWKFIVTTGAYIPLQKLWKIQLYFDQYGIISQKLGLKHIPAVVKQEGNVLRIDEL
ncbi:MAG: hypothetical protein QM520_00265 [Gammaproteobacteria bacterium]|nr:hypothetical protein [Gammaproteobacteria bacterium]